MHLLVQHNWSSVQWLTKTVRMRMLWLLQLLKYFPSKQNRQKALLQRILSIKTSRAQMRQLEPYLDSSLKYYRFNFILFHKYSGVRISDGRRLYTFPCGIRAKLPTRRCALLQNIPCLVQSQTKIIVEASWTRLIFWSTERLKYSQENSYWRAPFQ